MVLPGVDVASIPQINALHNAMPGYTSMAVGLHPTEVYSSWEADLNIILSHISDHGVVAVGEIGMDLHESDQYKDEQIEAFKVQVKAASEHNLPIIIHQREALAETLNILKEANENNYLPNGMVFHCFTGTTDDVAQIRQIAPDAYFGIGGVVTFKSAKDLRSALPQIGIDHIVLETDAPWLAPVPFRGKRNESSYLPHIVSIIADTLSMPEEAVCSTTDLNAFKLFPKINRKCT